jgi:UDP-N-acetylenolpyruvoylglucosamine reductase
MSKMSCLEVVINPSLNGKTNDKETVEKTLNAFKLAEAVKEFIMWHNPQKLSYYTNEVNRRNCNRATVDMGNNLLISFSGFNLNDI